MKNILYKILILIIAVFFLSIIFQSIIVRFSYDSIFPEKIDIFSITRLIKKNIVKLIVSSLFIAFISSISTVLISYPIARFISFNKINSILYVMLLLPILMPQFVSSFGILNVLNKFHLENTYIGVILSHMIIMLPYAIINISNDIKIVGNKYEEAAVVMGASNKKILLDITYPLIKNTLINTVALLLIISFSQYFLTLVTGGGLVKTYAIFIYPLIQGSDRNVSSNAILIYTLINIILYFVIIKKSKNVRY